MNPYMAKPKLDEQSARASRTKNINIPTEIIEHLLTPSEVRMLKNRWQILNLLEDGLSIRSIAKQIKVGTDTVVRVARMAERKNLKTFFKKDTFTTRTPWIFGKNE